MSSQNYRYFMIPFDKVPMHPDYEVWFATWSARRSAFVWSRERPYRAANGAPTRVIAASDASELPADATVITSSIKCIDPPVVAVPSDAISDAEFRAALTAQLTESLEIKSL